MRVFLYRVKEGINNMLATAISQLVEYAVQKEWIKDSKAKKVEN